MTDQNPDPVPTASLFDDRRCTLGEGPLWHPGRAQLFWFDILGRRLLSRSPDRQHDNTQEWHFDEYVSAAGWTGQDSLLIASQTALWHFDIGTGHHEKILPLEADNPVTRSNDGRADPWGGFWIGTMGKALEHGAGAIYRYYQGELRQVFDKITISNAICFSPEGHWVYFTDTPRQTIWRQALRSADGWPAATEPEIFIDLRSERLNPDGAVVDSTGCLWNAQWGASRVACYGPDGSFSHAVSFAASQISCPAFGGAELQTLFATSATEGLPDASGSADGQTFALRLEVTGQSEHQIRL